MTIIGIQYNPTHLLLLPRSLLLLLLLLRLLLWRPLKLVEAVGIIQDAADCLQHTRLHGTATTLLLLLLLPVIQYSMVGNERWRLRCRCWMATFSLDPPLRLTLALAWGPAGQ